MPFEKPNPIFLFQTLNMAAQSLLADVEPLCRFAALLKFISSAVARKYSMLFRFIVNYSP